MSPNVIPLLSYLKLRSSAKCRKIVLLLFYVPTRNCFLSHCHTHEFPNSFLLQNFPAWLIPSSLPFVRAREIFSCEILIWEYERKYAFTHLVVILHKSSFENPSCCCCKTFNSPSILGTLLFMISKRSLLAFY